MIGDRRQAPARDAHSQASDVQREAVVRWETRQLFGAHQQPDVGAPRAFQKRTSDTRYMLVQIRDVERARVAQSMLPPPQPEKLIQRRRHRAAVHGDTTPFETRQRAVGVAQLLVHEDDRRDHAAIVCSTRSVR